MLLVICGGLWVFELNREILKSSSRSWFPPPVEYYSATTTLTNKPGDSPFESPPKKSYPRFHPEKHPRKSLQRDPHQSQKHQENLKTQGHQLFAQFYNEKPVLRQILTLGEIPLFCLQAITAIEDNRFLDHGGINFTSIFRATLKNIINIGFVEGGSTITQQLVKNYFLTPQRTIKRKLKEIIMAMLLELRLDKDEILQHYLNVIYMGQSGPFEVRGYGSASQHYFGKTLASLNLPECALMAAIVNSPGRFDPSRHSERARQRRHRVLRKMAELNMIEEDEREQADKFPLPTGIKKGLSQPPFYYLQAVRRELKNLNIDSSKGLKVYTHLDIFAQESAHQSLRQQMPLIENFSTEQLKKQMEQMEGKLRRQTKNPIRGKKLFPTGHHAEDLQALLISIRLDNASIVALEGGRGYKKTQYNRALDAHRQVGSIMKPFVYLAALESIDENGQPYTPLTLLNDTPFTHKYEGQTWKPQNYQRDFKGSVPLFYALKNSINIPTARLGLQVGLSSVMDVTKRLGVKSKIIPLPSLVLGAFELYPLEVAEAFTTIARGGNFSSISTISRVESLQGDLLYQRDLKNEIRVAPESAATLIGMLKQTVTTGTARSLSSWRGWTRPTAGKTGTTNHTKDNWFVGFTPYVLTVVWVGYDDNRPTGLTGASGALPLWWSFMKKYGSTFPADDFLWPENTSSYEYSIEDLAKTVIELSDYERKIHTLIFRKGHEPEPHSSNKPHSSSDND